MTNEEIAQELNMIIECIKQDGQDWVDERDIPLFEGAIKELLKKQVADVEPVRHGRWHVMNDDPYDESGCPTEEGEYRVIDWNGNEYTDYFFAKPTIMPESIRYWEKSQTTIRAWAKIDEEDEEEQEILNARKGEE